MKNKLLFYFDSITLQKVLLLVFLSAFLSLKSQTLIMNEVSNGPSGNMEYTEFVVADTTVTYNCNGLLPPPCIDIRGWVFDDNSGYHNAVGVAAGAIRFSNNTFWSCIPVGTIILIYNNLDPNSSLPVDDLSMTDGNCKLVIPVSNTTLFDQNATTPGAIACSYPPIGWNPGGNWNNTLFANGGDCARVVNLAGCEVFSVCWGTANANNLIYFSGSAQDRVYSFTNNLNNNHSNQLNWTNGCTDPTTCGTNNQTPGAPNNAANAAWIASMNNSCAPISTLSAIASSLSSSGSCPCTGQATVNASGSIGPYTYSWSPSPGGGQGTASVTGLCNGIYTVTVSSFIGCTKTLTLSINNLQSPSLTINSATICNGGSATLSAIPSASGGTFSWTPGGFTTSSIVVNPVVTTTYNLTYSLTGCSINTIAVVNVSSQPTLTVNSPSVCSNSSATLTVTGATNYTWSTGSNSNSISVNPFSTTVYTVTGSVAGCTNSIVSNVMVFSQPTISVISPTICFGSTATITANGALTYTWSNSLTSNSIIITPTSNITYTVFGTTSICTSSAQVNVFVSPIMTATLTTTNVSCYNGANGSATLLVGGGNPGYSYNWTPSGGTSSVASSFSAGNYTATITDMQGCTLTAVAIITQPLLPLASIVNFTNATCGMSNGSASVTTSGGTPGYTFGWSPAGGTSNSATNLSAGNYSVFITDANNCQLTKTVTIIQPNSMSFTVNTNSVTCNGGSNGLATINVAGGTAPYSYTWSPTPFAGQGSPNAIGLSAQIYTITVSDNLGCTTLTTATITQPAAALAAIPSVTNILCFGSATGSASVVASGGTPGYTYTWSPSGGNSSVAFSLIAGPYSVTIMDANNCTLSINVNVLQPAAPLSAIVSATNVLCFGSNNGSAGATVNGGTPGYTYNWTPTGGTNTVASNLAPGNYTITVKDINNCTVTSFTSISQPANALTASVTSSNVSCSGASNGSATITAIGGTSGYTFNWLPSLASSSLNPLLSAGTHTAFVLDANNCTFSLTTIITQPSPIGINVNGIKLCSGQNGILLGNVNGGIAPYSYMWNNNPGSFSIAVNANASVIYSLSVTDANGCNSPIDTAMVTIASPLLLSVSPTKTICAGISSGLSANAFGGVGTYQYNWTPVNVSGQLISVNLNSTTIYTITVTDGCSQPAIATTTVFVETIDTPTLIANIHSGCSPVCVSFTNTTFTPSLSVQNSLWTFSDGSLATGLSAKHCFDKPGMFTAYNSFTTSSGCTGSVQLKEHIKVFQKPDADFTANTYLYDNFNPQINFYNNSVNAIYYFWDFGGLGSSTFSNSSYSFNEPGKYLVTLIAMNEFCSDTAYRIIECLPVFTFYAPNTFTPNNDKVNDFFFPLGEGWDIKTYSLMIFDRWGENIFQTTHHDEGWNGRYKNEDVKKDIYIWKVSLKDIFGKHHSYVGHVSLVK